jgi:hypothetical protein
MSKPLNIPTKHIKKPKLRTKDLCIAAIEDGGKIIAFEVRYKDEPPERYDVGKGPKGMTDAFKRAEAFATKLITADAPKK